MITLYILGAIIVYLAGVAITAYVDGRISLDGDFSERIWWFWPITVSAFFVCLCVVWIQEFPLQCFRGGRNAADKRANKTKE